MPLDGEPNDFKSTAEGNPEAVFGEGSLLEDLEAANDNAEQEFSLDSKESIRSLFEHVGNNAVDSWMDEHPGDWEGFSGTESCQLLTELHQESKKLEEKVGAGELSDTDAIVLQALIDKFDDLESSEDPLDSSDEDKSFDPNSYIDDQFAEHPYLIPSQRSPVYLLQREYKRALAEGATRDAESLAQQIKDHVDELVGNDQIDEEGKGVDLTSEKHGTSLTPEDLDSGSVGKVSVISSKPVVLEEPPEQIVGLTPTTSEGIDLSSAGQNDGEVDRDLAEKERSVEKLRMVREAKELERMNKKEIETIEGFKAGGFFSNKSPYEALAEVNFETLVFNSQAPYVNGVERGKFLHSLKRDNIDQAAFNEWMKLLPMIDTYHIETADKTFKEVADALVQLRLEERNTQLA